MARYYPRSVVWRASHALVAHPLTLPLFPPLQQLSIGKVRIWALLALSSPFASAIDIYPRRFLTTVVWSLCRAGWHAETRPASAHR